MKACFALPRSQVQRVVVVFLVSTVLGDNSFVSCAIGTSVTFDVSPLIACRDVTPEEFSRVNPAEKLVEAKFRVSVLLHEGREDDIDDLVVTLVSPERRLRVVDFSPRSQHVTDIVGKIERVETTEIEQSLKASIVGNLGGQYGIGTVQATPSAGAGRVQRNVAKESYQRLPPRKLILTSGTTHAEHGLFFKLKPSKQATLEGMKEFTLQFAVPIAWRGDWAIVTCQARSYRKNFLSGSVKRHGHLKTAVGLYLLGDTHAKHVAAALGRLQAEELLNPRKPTLVRRIFLSNDDPLGARASFSTSALRTLFTRTFAGTLIDLVPKKDSGSRSAKHAKNTNRNGDKDRLSKDGDTQGKETNGKDSQGKDIIDESGDRTLRQQQSLRVRLDALKQLSGAPKVRG